MELYGPLLRTSCPPLTGGGASLLKGNGACPRVNQATGALPPLPTPLGCAPDVKGCIQRKLLQRRPEKLIKRTNWSLNKIYIKIFQKKLQVYSCRNLGIQWDMFRTVVFEVLFFFFVTMYLTSKPTLYKTSKVWTKIKKT